MGANKEYIRIIKAVYPVNKASIIGYWIYLRIEKRGYNLFTKDELDESIYNDIGKKNNQVKWETGEVKNFLNGRNLFNKKIEIIPNVSETAIEDIDKIEANKFEMFPSIIHFLCTREKDDPELSIVPTVISALVPTIDFKKLVESYRPYQHG